MEYNSNIVDKLTDIIDKTCTLPNVLTNLIIEYVDNRPVCVDCYRYCDHDEYPYYCENCKECICCDCENSMKIDGGYKEFCADCHILCIPECDKCG